MRCHLCGAAIEDCAFCDEPGCQAAICCRCLRVGLRIYRWHIADDDGAG